MRTNGAVPPAMPIAPSPGENMPVAGLAEGERLKPRMGSWDSVFRSSFWYAGYNPDELTTQKGFDKYDEMLAMAACRTPLNVLLYGVLRKGWTVEPAVKDPEDKRQAEAQELADALRYALENIEDEPGNVQDFRAVLFALGRAAWYGFKVAEINWKMMERGDYKGKLGFESFADKPCKMIGFDLDKDTLAVRNFIPYTPLTGYGPPFPVQKSLRYTFQPKDNLPHGNGLGRDTYRHWFFLDKTLRLWAMAAERTGGPVPTFKYPAGSAVDMQAATDAANIYRSSGIIVIPSNVESELMANPHGALDDFKSLADWHTDQCSRAILNNTLTTGEGRQGGGLGGSLGQTHDDTQKDAESYIREDLETIATLQVARRFVLYNFGEEALSLCPKIGLGDYDDTDRKAKADMYGTLIDKGVVHKSAKFIRDDLGLPPMDDKEQALIESEDKAEQDRLDRQADARLQGKGGVAK